VTLSFAKILNELFGFEGSLIWVDSTMNTRDDEVLLREFCLGSEDAFRELAQRYGAIVYAACLKSLRRPEMAEDAAQAVFLVLLKKAERLRVRTTLIPWLLATSRVVCRNFTREERRRRRFEQPLQEDVAATEAIFDGSIFEALGKLRDPDREAIVLRFVQGLSLGEVGRLQGISEDAARMRVKRGVSKLRENFVPSLFIPPSLFNRLASPKAAPALIQQLAMKSATMAITSTTALVAFVGIAAIGAAGSTTFYRSRTPALPGVQRPNVARKAEDSTSTGPSSGGEIPVMQSEFTLRYQVYSKSDPEGHHFVLLSSEGSDLLIQEENDSSGELTPGMCVIVRDNRSYMPIGSHSPSAHANMWVTSSIYAAPPFPLYVGASFPAIHPLAELTGNGKQTVGSLKLTANIYLRGLPPERPYVLGECSFMNVAKNVRVLSSIAAGTIEEPYRVWNLSGFQKWNGFQLASQISDTSYLRSGTEPSRVVLDWTRYVLRSKASYAQPFDLFHPEHYLDEGDHVEYKIPMQAGMKLDFTYHRNRGTVEDQAKAQDTLELNLQRQGG